MKKFFAVLLAIALLAEQALGQGFPTYDSVTLLADPANGNQATRSSYVTPMIAAAQTSAARRTRARRVVSHFTVNNNGFAPTAGFGARAATTLGLASAVVVNPGMSGTNGSFVATGTTGMGTKFQVAITVSSGAVSAIGAISVPGTYVVPPTNLAAEPVSTNSSGLTGVTLAVSFGINVPSLGTYGATAVTVAAGGSGCSGGSSQYGQGVNGTDPLGVAHPIQFRGTIASGALTAVTSIIDPGDWGPGGLPANLAGEPIIERDCQGATVAITAGIVRTAQAGIGGIGYSTASATILGGGGTGATAAPTVSGGAVSGFSGSGVSGSGYTSLPSVMLLGPVSQGGYVATDRGEGDVTPETAVLGGIANPTIQFCNWTLQAADASGTGLTEKAGPPITISNAGIEYPVGVSPAVGNFRAATFGGRPSITIDPFACVETDAIGVYIPPSTGYLIRNPVISTAPSGVPPQWPIGGMSSTRPGAAVVNTQYPAALVVNSAVAQNSGNYNYRYAPTAVIAETTNDAWMLVGDSIWNGYLDQSEVGLAGTPARALGYNVGWTKVSLPSDTIANWMAYNSVTGRSQSAARRALGYRYYTRVAAEIGTNDFQGITGSAAWTPIQTNLFGLYDELHAVGLRVYLATALPRPIASSDGFATSGGQTVGVGWGAQGGATLYNTMARACGTPGNTHCDGYLEYEALLTQTLGSGIWLTDGLHPQLYTYEGTHPYEVATNRGITAAAINGPGSGCTSSGSGVILTGTAGTNGNPIAPRVSVTIAAAAVASVDSVVNSGAWITDPATTASPFSGGGCAGVTLNLTTALNPASIGYSMPANGTPVAGSAAAALGIANIAAQFTAIMATP